MVPVWHPRLANCYKSEQHRVLKQELQKVCTAKGLSTDSIYAPIITSTLKQMVTGFQFIGFGPNDLTSGRQPFLVSYAGSNHHYNALPSSGQRWEPAALARRPEKCEFSGLPLNPQEGEGEDVP